MGIVESRKRKEIGYTVHGPVSALSSLVHSGNTVQSLQVCGADQAQAPRDQTVGQEERKKEVRNNCRRQRAVEI